MKRYVIITTRLRNVQILTRRVIMIPLPEFAKSLEDHLKYVGADVKMQTRLEICYLLFIPFSKAYSDKEWED